MLKERTIGATVPKETVPEEKQGRSGIIFSRRSFLKFALSAIFLASCDNNGSRYIGGNPDKPDNPDKPLNGARGSRSLIPRGMDKGYSLYEVSSNREIIESFEKWNIVRLDLNDKESLEGLRALGLYDDFVDVDVVAAGSVFSFVGVSHLAQEMLRRISSEGKNLKKAIDYFLDHVKKRAQEEDACNLPRGHSAELALIIALSALGLAGSTYAIKGAYLEESGVVNTNGYFSYWSIYSVPKETLKPYLERLGLTFQQLKIHELESGGKFYLRMMHGIGSLDNKGELVKSFTGTTAHLISPRNVQPILDKLNTARIEALRAINNQDVLDDLVATGMIYLRQFLREILRRYKGVGNICSGLQESASDDNKKGKKPKKFSLSSLDSILDPTQEHDILIELDEILRKNFSSLDKNMGSVNIGDFKILFR